MAVTLAKPSNNYNNSNFPQLSNISDNKARRANRLRGDLTKVYTEASVKAKASFLNLPYIDLYGFPVDTSHLILLPKSVSQRAKIGVFSIQNKRVDLATPMPGQVGQDQVLNQLKKEGYNPIVHLCSDLSFNRLLSRYDFVMEFKKVSDDIVLNQAEVDNLQEQDNSLKNLEEKVSNVPVTEAVETILISAIQNKASDIHFEPEKNAYVLRFRLDGVLHTFAKINPAKIKPFENRLKLISGVKLNVDNVPQDGRFSFKVGEKEIDVRVSMLPSNFGYSIVMRLLGTGNVALELKELGFIGEAKNRVTRAVDRPQGLILTTGPTGSGKTTTLYTFLSQLNNGGSKIITLEDPIEYKLSGISQTQIDAQGGYTFSSGIRSILRQDPDVVMVGEIRDSETAEIAIQASLTGHQVLSTIHTNDAAGAIPRLMEMKIKGFLIADSLSAVIGQRLVRRICPKCQQIYNPKPEETEIINRELANLPSVAKNLIPQNFQFKTATGCEFCNNLGYKGRVGVYEVMTVTDGLRDLLSHSEISIMDVRRTATKEGMVTMFQDGLIKATLGMTDIPEVMRIVASN